MPNYNWLEHAKISLFERFPEWANGIGAWRSYVETVLTEPSPLRLDEFRASVGPILPVLPCPRVFVSHRRIDKKPALRIAELANDKGFELWLDILDPKLRALPSMVSPTAAQKALITAGIIEMALINSTHVIAVLTQATRGSLWVPYEYGRVKDAPAVSSRTGAWVHPKLTAKRTPEYLALGIVTRKELDIRCWFATELKNWQSTYRSCLGGTTASWDGGKTEPLPS